MRRLWTAALSAPVAVLADWARSTCMLEHCDGKPILAVEEPRFGRGGHSDDVLGVGGHESVVRVQPTAMPGGPAQWIPTCAVDSKAQQRDLCVPPNATQPMVLKALQDGKRGKTELSFYRRHQHGRGCVPREFLPAFFGSGVISSGASALDTSQTCGSNQNVFTDPRLCAPRRQHVLLEDLTGNLVAPCVADVKVGTRTWRHGTLSTKVSRVLFKYPYQAVLGFRFTGMAVFRPHHGTNGGYVKFSRDYGWSLTPDSVLDGFRQFLYDGQRVRLELVPPLLEKIQKIRRWFQTQRCYQFYSSSLLLVYDGAAASAEDAIASLDVRMIDFAHAMPANMCSAASSCRGVAAPVPSDPVSDASIEDVSRNAYDSSYVYGLLNIERALRAIQHAGTQGSAGSS